MVKYKLQVPVTYDDKEYTELELKRPKGKHLKKLPAEPKIKDMLELAARCAGVSTAMVDELDGVDVIGVTEVLGGFLENGPAIG